MTGPWPAEVATLTTGPHAVTARATALLPGASEPTSLDVTSLRIGWDESRAPRCTATMTCPMPEASLLTALDPRQRVRVSVLIGYRLGSGVLDEQTVATLDLRRVSEDQPARTLTLECVGVESRVVDNGVPPLTSGGAVSTRGLIVDAFATFWSPAANPLVVDPAVDDIVEAHAADYGAEPWSLVDDWADRLGADLYDPGDGTVRLAPRPTRAARSALVLRTGPGGTLTRTTSRRSREAWHNSVHLRYDNGGDPSTWVYGNADAAAPYAPSAVGYVTFVETRRGSVTQTTANRAAATVLARMLSGGRSYDAEAIAAWWLRPGDTVTVETSRDAQERHLVSRVDFAWPDNTMTLTTRAPEA